VEGDVAQSDRSRRPRRVVALIRNGEEIDRVGMTVERHEDAAMLRVLFRHLKPEDRGVELLRALNVADPQQHVPNARESYHRRLAGLSCPSASCPRRTATASSVPG